MERLQTIVVGSVFPSEDSGYTVRIVRDSTGAYRVLGSTLGPPFAALLEAQASVERLLLPKRSGSPAIEWRADLSSREGEHPCAICSAPVAHSARYPQQICAACVLEACDEGGRAVRFQNTTTFGGGIEGTYRDDGSRYANDECFVRGSRCQAQEHRFGGIVMQPAR